MTLLGAIMPRSRRSTLCVVASSIALLLASTSPLTLAAEVDVALIGRLKAIWDGFDSDVTTAHIRWRKIGRSVSVPSSLEAVQAALEKFDVINIPDAVFPLSDALGMGLDAAKPSWGKYESWIDGKLTRYDHWSGGKLAHVLSFDGRQDVYLRGHNNQLDIYPPGRSGQYQYDLAHFRCVPQIDDPADVKEMESLEAGRVRLRTRGHDYVVDSGTGFVYRDTAGDRARTVQDRMYVEPVVYPGNIVFPKAIIWPSVSSGVVTSLFITVVEEASFNVKIPENVFAVVADPTLHIVDYREDMDNPRDRRIDSATTDVVARIDGTKERIPQSVSRWAVAAYIGSLFAAIVVALAAYTLRWPKKAVK